MYGSWIHLKLSIEGISTRIRNLIILYPWTRKSFFSVHHVLSSKRYCYHYAMINCNIAHLVLKNNHSITHSKLLFTNKILNTPSPLLPLWYLQTFLRDDQGYIPFVIVRSPYFFLHDLMLFYLQYITKRNRTNNTITKRNRTNNTITKRNRTNNTITKRKRTNYNNQKKKNKQYNNQKKQESCFFW
jgi:hypothetical protein